LEKRTVQLKRRELWCSISIKIKDNDMKREGDEKERIIFVSDSIRRTLLDSAATKTPKQHDV